MENEATTKTPIPTRSGFRNFALCTLTFALPNPLSVCLFVPLCLSGQDPRSTLVETPLQISLFFAKQSQCQNGQNKHKYSKNKGLCQRTTNNEQRMLSKTNPIKPNHGTIRNTRYEIRTLSPRDTQYAIRDTKYEINPHRCRGSRCHISLPPSHSSKTERTTHRSRVFCPNPLLIGLFPG